MGDPIFYEAGEWFFWDEVWADKLGPFPNEVMARQKLEEYCEWLDTGNLRVYTDK